MKKLISILLAAGIAATAFAQPQDQAGKGRKGPGYPDHEKIKAERVAFITSEVGLTAEEAQAFWPVYNKIEEQQVELMKSERTAFMALNKALKDGEGDVQKLLDDYLKAKAANVNLHVANAKDYKKVLSAEKVAKFFTCEEKFRRMQIGKLSGHGKGPGGPGPGDGKTPGKGPRPEKGARPDKAAKDV